MTFPPHHAALYLPHLVSVQGSPTGAGESVCLMPSRGKTQFVSVSPWKGLVCSSEPNKAYVLPSKMIISNTLQVNARDRPAMLLTGLGVMVHSLMSPKRLFFPQTIRARFLASLYFIETDFGNV